MHQVRPAVASDAAAISEVHVRSWQQAYVGLLPDDLLAAQSIERRLRFWADALESDGASATWVVDVAGRVVGFVSVGRCRDPDRSDPNAWEIYALYLLAEHWGHGLGGRLLLEALPEAVPPSASLSLWVLAGNERALRFYTALGFVPDGTEKQERLGGLLVTEVRLLRPGSSPESSPESSAESSPGGVSDMP